MKRWIAVKNIEIKILRDICKLQCCLPWFFVHPIYLSLLILLIMWLVMHWDFLSRMWWVVLHWDFLSRMWHLEERGSVYALVDFIFLFQKNTQSKCKWCPTSWVMDIDYKRDGVVFFPIRSIDTLAMCEWVSYIRYFWNTFKWFSLARLLSFFIFLCVFVFQPICKLDIFWGGRDF